MQRVFWLSQQVGLSECPVFVVDVAGVWSWVSVASGHTFINEQACYYIL
jgi:hypothetical protein